MRRTSPDYLWGIVQRAQDLSRPGYELIDLRFRCHCGALEIVVSAAGNHFFEIFNCEPYAVGTEELRRPCRDDIGEAVHCDAMPEVESLRGSW